MEFGLELIFKLEVLIVVVGLNLSSVELNLVVVFTVTLLAEFELEVELAGLQSVVAEKLLALVDFVD